MAGSPLLSSLIGQAPKAVVVDGAEYRLRMLSAAELFDFSSFQSGEPRPSSAAVMAKLLGYALSDESGGRALSDEEAAIELPKVPAARLAELFHAAIAHSRVSKADEEEAEKN